ncbi:MAG: TerC family protein [Pseudomonadota bacterium]|nr:TerC family protein [Pseudomonadota bacterium]
MDFLDAEWLAPFVQVVIIDLTLAGDNAVVIGLAAAGLPVSQRGRAIAVGILAATVLRIGFSIVATQLLQIVGLLLAGGVLLLWVAWKMWRELHPPKGSAHARQAGGEAPPAKSLGQAILQIVLADLSMSLDNVLAVAGAAREHPSVLIFGLTLSIVLMGVAATLIARVLQKHRWVAYIGLLIILFVALEMIWRGGEDVLDEPAVQEVIEEGLEAVQQDPAPSGSEPNGSTAPPD